MTGRDFLEKECDEKFWEDDLNQEGNDFARYYYESNMYFADYESVLARDLPSFYHVDNSWDNYHKLAPVITKQFLMWKNSQAKKWWQFWK